MKREEHHASGDEVLAGVVERVTYHNEDTGFCVLRIKARGHRELITVVGHAAAIAAGEWLTASGEWIGAHSLNIELQAALNPAGEHKVERFGWTYAPGDKIMQIENDYDKEVFNGDIGYVEAVNEDDGDLTTNFDGRSVVYGFGELNSLVPAYAVTIHFKARVRNIRRW